MMAIVAVSVTQETGKRENKFLKGILGENIVMEPLEGKTGEPACLIFIIGAHC